MVLAADLEGGLRLRLVRADEIPAPGLFLSGPELEKCASFRVEKRRKDWLGGRYAAKLLVKEILAPASPLAAIPITYDECGRPVWRTAGGSRLLSITHSGPFCAAACAAETAVFLGIDLEKKEPREAAWYRDYFHKEELAAGPAEETATSLWTRKEALLKALGLGLKADPLDIDLSGKAPRFSRAAAARYEEMGSPPFLLKSFPHEKDYILSIAWQPAANNG